MADKISSEKQHRFLPLTIRIATVGGIATPLVLRGTPLPTKRSDVFSTATDNQGSIIVDLLVGERPLTKDNIPIGSFELKEIPPALRGVPQIRVEFSVNAACVVTARAEIQGTSIAAEQTLEMPMDLNAETISKILATADATSEADGMDLKLAEATNRAQSMIHRAEERLKKAPNSREINQAVASLGLALAKNDADTIRDNSDALESLIVGSSNAADFSNIFAQFFQTPSRVASARPAPSRQQTPQRPKHPSEVVAAAHSPNLGKIFGSSTFTLDSQLCFVIMPFTDSLQPIYEDSIRPIVMAAGLRCERADDVRGVGLITWDIWERINRARFLIADLSGLNANVFYELGLAHALSKDVVLITQSMDFVPFDVKGLRCICYDATHRGTQKLERQLTETIAALTAS